MTFGEKLRESRINKGLTQSELAKAAKLGINTIGNYENGKSYPKARETYDLLASILDVEPSYLKSENEEFLLEATERYGYSGAKQAELLVKNGTSLFAGDEISEEDKDIVMMQLQKAYWIYKEQNQNKAKKKKRKKKTDK